MRNPDVIYSGTNIYPLNDRYPLAGVAQGATFFPAAFQGFRQQVQGLEEPPVELLSLQARPGLELEFFMYNGVNEVEGKWVIRDKSDGQPVGSCDLNSEELGEVQLGYCLAKAYWGKELATEVARAVMRFALEDLKLERLVAVVVPENIAFWKLLEHIGFTFEKKAHYYGWDVVYYGIPRDQFQYTDSFYCVLFAPNPNKKGVNNAR